jgi:lipopolysaccharide export system protein LptA
VRSLSFLFLVFIFALASYAANFNEKTALGDSCAIHITADKIEAYNKKGLYKFEGRVISKRCDITLKSDIMDIYRNNKSNKIYKIVCLGNVVITKKDKIAKADKAIYEDLKHKITLIGHAKLVSNKNEMTSDIIVYYTDKDYAVSQSIDKNNRVEVTVYPNIKEKK